MLKKLNFRRMSTAFTRSPVTESSTQHAGPSGLLSLKGLQANLAETMEQCFEALERNNLPAFPVVGKDPLFI